MHLDVLKHYKNHRESFPVFLELNNLHLHKPAIKNKHH